MLVIVRNNDPIKAYKLLSKKLLQEGIVNEVRERMYFKSKSQKAREDKKRGIAKYKKQEAKRQMIADKIESQIIRGGYNGKNKRRK
jgi:ribosomal protein S21